MDSQEFQLFSEAMAGIVHDLPVWIRKGIEQKAEHLQIGVVLAYDYILDSDDNDFVGYTLPVEENVN